MWFCMCAQTCVCVKTINQSEKMNFPRSPSSTIKAIILNSSSSFYHHYLNSNVTFLSLISSGIDFFFFYVLLVLVGRVISRHGIHIVAVDIKASLSILEETRESKQVNQKPK